MEVQEYLHTLFLRGGNGFFHIGVVVIHVDSIRVVYFLCPLWIVPQPEPDELRSMIFEYPVRISHGSLIAVNTVVIHDLIHVREVGPEVKFFWIFWRARIGLFIFIRLA